MLSIHLQVKQPIFWMTTFTCKIPSEMSAHLLGDWDWLANNNSLQHLVDLSKAKLLICSIPYLYHATTEEMVPDYHAHVGHKCLNKNDEM